mmetsp:Transcript_44003/g.115607  ORF Transcript_44003/g.115607 Transcript_44003/m.115607 type:complete len:452 (+) Transcript_44003:91-1446(+)
MPVETGSFDAVRGIGALVVAASHWTNEFRFQRYYLGANNAVAMFILMSGFVMAVAYGDAKKLEAVGFSQRFWVRRVSRIGPLYWLSLVPFVGLVLQWGRLDFDLLAPVLGTRWSIPAAFFSMITFTQGWTWLGFHDIQAINVPLWTVCAQATCYVACPTLLRTLYLPLRRPLCLFVLQILGLWLLYLALWFGTGVLYWHWVNVFAFPYCRAATDCDWVYMSTSGPPDVGQGYYAAHKHPLNKVALFAMGMLCGLQATSKPAEPLLDGGKSAKAPLGNRGTSSVTGGSLGWKLVCDALSVVNLGWVVAVTYVLHSHPMALLVGRWTPLLLGELFLPLANAAWLYMLTQAHLAPSAAALRAWPLRWLGRISFAVYCLHWPTMEYYCWARFGELWIEHRLDASKLLRPWDSGLVAILVMAVSWAGSSIERHCQGWLQERLTRLLSTTQTETVLH